MLTKQQKIDAIYEKIARKDLTFWCRIILKNQAIVLESLSAIESNCMDYYDVGWAIIGRYWTKTIWWITMEIEKIYFDEPSYNEEEVSNDFKEEFVFDENNEEKDWNLEIIGHPVMIGDVMNHLEIFSKNKIIDVWYVIKHWMIKTMPIEDQSDECIDFIYSLISK